jgi:hypothetical protein
MVTIADSSGKELRALRYKEYDFEIGNETSDFMISQLIPDWQDIPDNARIYIPNTEYGGIYKRLETDTKVGTISVGGYTWRGMMRNKIISPPPGEDYATDMGDINTIIDRRVREAFGGVFVGGAPCGVSARGEFQYNRYCTLYDGLTKMLASVGYKMDIRYNVRLKRVVVTAVPIIDHSERIEFSSDVSAHYYMLADKAGVNHLICLGNGELRNRIVVHLYADAKGRISQNQTFFGSDEIAQIYDYAGADRLQLIESGTQQLETLLATNQFSLDVEGMTLEIGDIVGGKDYVSGTTMKASIVGKIHKSADGVETTEYTISDNVEVTD